MGIGRLASLPFPLIVAKKPLTKAALLYPLIKFPEKVPFRYLLLIQEMAKEEIQSAFLASLLCQGLPPYFYFALIVLASTLSGYTYLVEFKAELLNNLHISC